jgi:hypothetical protein
MHIEPKSTIKLRQASQLTMAGSDRAQTRPVGESYRPDISGGSADGPLVASGA